MPSTMFMAILPQKLEEGNKVLIRGTLSNAPEEFSINFVNEISQYPQNIAYHFKWILGMDTIVQNSKKDGEWMEERPIDIDAFDGPTFALEFAFQDDGIYVYLVYEEGRNLITHYELDCQLSEIQSLQVWGDVQKINQLTFTYD